MRYLPFRTRLVLSSVILAGLLLWMLPTAGAVGLGAAPGSVPGADISTGNSPEGAVVAMALLIQRIADGLATLAAAVAILFMVINGARLTFSLGDSEALGKAKKGFLWATGGLILIIFAYIITKSVVALTYSGADGSSTIGTAMINAPGSSVTSPVAGGDNPNDLCKLVGALPPACLGATELDTTTGFGSRNVSVSGLNRIYDYYIPPSANDGATVPLLLVFHDTGGTRGRMAGITGFSDLAETREFAVAYLDGLVYNGDSDWDLSETFDYDFVKAVINRMSADLDGNLGGVYTAGIGSGAAFAQAAGCAIAEVDGVAAIDGALYPAERATCNHPGGLEMLGFYGTQDPAADIDNFEDTFEFFAGINGCSTTLYNTSQPNIDPADNTTVDLLAPVGGCSATMGYYRVNNGGYFWPDGNYTPSQIAAQTGALTRDINASVIIADAFGLASSGGGNGDTTDLDTCNANAVTALAGVCSDLGIAPCSILGIEQNLATQPITLTPGCGPDDENFDTCTFRDLQVLYRTQCIK